jgi:hypothetical protein
MHGEVPEVARRKAEEVMPLEMPAVTSSEVVALEAVVSEAVALEAVVSEAVALETAEMAMSMPTEVVTALKLAEAATEATMNRCATSNTTGVGDGGREQHRCDEDSYYRGDDSSGHRRPPFRRAGQFPVYAR